MESILAKLGKYIGPLDEAEIGRLVETPEDLVGIISFLSSADSDFITGQTILVDGGAFMH